ncbi:MAG: RNA polymerase sigma factor [Gemmatimonadota bacterium]|nr:MAG: RNA polymerase sigma factor [Gemmatimonadota bacterium]
MRLTSEGDRAAFKRLVEKYHKAVLNLAYRFLGNREEAEDAAQEVFLRVYNSAKRYEPQAQFTTWLFRIATNFCLNKLRHRQRLQEVPLESSSNRTEQVSDLNLPAPEQTRPDDHLEQKERNRIIAESIASLPPNQRMAVILKRFEGLSYQEIAKVLNVSVSAVESLLFRAKQTLKKKLEPYVQNV